MAVPWESLVGVVTGTPSTDRFSDRGYKVTTPSLFSIWQCRGDTPVPCTGMSTPIPLPKVTLPGIEQNCMLVKEDSKIHLFVKKEHSWLLYVKFLLNKQQLTFTVPLLEVILKPNSMISRKLIKAVKPEQINHYPNWRGSQRWQAAIEALQSVNRLY